MIGTFEALWAVIKQLAINGYQCMSIGDLYIPNTNVLGSKNVNNVPVSTYYNSSTGNTVDSASHNASQQIFDFYWGLSPYLHMVKPSTQFLRTWISWIADGLYGIDSFLTYLYVNLFGIMGLRSSYSPSSGFFNLLHDGQLLGIAACIIATICYFGMMILAPQGETISKLKILFRNIILGAAIIGFLPTISNTFIVGTQYEAQRLIGNGSTSGSGEHMDNLAADYFRQNVISVPHKISSLGLKPNGTPYSKKQNKNKGSDTTYGIQVPESHNRIVYRPKSTFYTPSPNDSSRVGNKPIASKQVSINLYAMSDQERNSWNGLNDVSVPSFLHEYGSDDSILDPNGNEDKYDKINKGKEVSANYRIKEAEESPQKREQLINKCENKHSAWNCRVNIYPKWHWVDKANKFFNDRSMHESDDLKHGGVISDSEAYVDGSLGGQVNKNGNARYIGTIMPAKQMIENLTVVAHAQSKKSSNSNSSNKTNKSNNNQQKTIKQTNQGNKQQTTKADSKKSENSDDNGIGLYNYELDGDDDYASIDAIKEGFMSKHVTNGSITSYYDKYKVCWFNIITGLLLLGFMLCAFIAKIATSFFKISVMYISVGIFMYKAVSAPQAWKVFIKSFFGIYEMLFMDVLMLRLWLMACFALDSDISTIVTRAAVGATDLVTGGITLICNFAMAMTALHGVDAVDKIMGPGANSGASHSWGDALTALTAMRIAGGAGRTAGRLGAGAVGLGQSGLSGAGKGLSKLHGHNMRNRATGKEGIMHRAGNSIKNGANAVKHPKRALNGFAHKNPLTHFKGEAISNGKGLNPKKRNKLAKKLNGKSGKAKNADNAVNGKKGKGTKSNNAFGSDSTNPSDSDSFDTTNGLNGENTDSDTSSDNPDNEPDTTGNDVDSDINRQFGDSNADTGNAKDNIADAKNSASIASNHAKAINSSSNKGTHPDNFGNQKANTTGNQPQTTKPNPNSRKDLTTRTANGLQHAGNGVGHVANGIRRATGNPTRPVTPVNHNNDVNTDGTIGQWQPQDGTDGQGTNTSASNQSDAFGNSTSDENDSTTGTEPNLDGTDMDTATAPSSSPTTSDSSSADNNVADFAGSNSQSNNSHSASDNMSADDINPNHVSNGSNASNSSNSRFGNINSPVGTTGNDVNSNVANDDASGNNSDNNISGNSTSSTGSTNTGNGNKNIKPNIKHQNLNVHHHANGKNASHKVNGSYNNTTGTNPINTQTTTTNSTDGTTPNNPDNHFTGQSHDISKGSGNDNSTTTTRNVTGNPITDNNSGNTPSTTTGSTNTQPSQTIIHRHINNINDNDGNNGTTTTTTTNNDTGSAPSTSGNSINSDFTPSGQPVGNQTDDNTPFTNTTTDNTNNGNSNQGASPVKNFDQVINMAHHNNGIGGNATTTHFTNQTNGFGGNTPSSTTTTTDSTNTNTGGNGNSGTHTIHNVINHHNAGSNNGGNTIIHRHINHINSTNNGSTPDFTNTTTTNVNDDNPIGKEPTDQQYHQIFNQALNNSSNNTPSHTTTSTNNSGSYNAFNDNQPQQILGGDDDKYTSNNDISDTTPDSDITDDVDTSNNGGLTDGLFRGLTGDNSNTDNDNLSGNHLNGSNNGSGVYSYKPHFKGSTNDFGNFGNHHENK